MVLETYFAGVAAVSLIFILFGMFGRGGFSRSFMIWGGFGFILLGLMVQDSGIDREINWRPYRDSLDQNRIYDINSTTTKFVGSTSTDTAPAGVVYDQGLWILSQIMFYIFGWIPVLIGIYSTAMLFFKGNFAMGWD